MTPNAPPKNPGLSVLLSFLWAGLGQIYNGQPLIGVPLAALVGFVGFVDWRIVSQAQWLGWSSVPSDIQLVFQASLGVLAVVWLWSMWYAHHVAMRFNATLGASATGTAPAANAQTTTPQRIDSTGDPGEDTWRLIETSRDKVLLEEFVAKFPNHPRAMMARILLGRMADEKDAPIASEVTTDCPPQSVQSMSATRTAREIPTAAVVTALAGIVAVVFALDQFGIVYFPNVFRSLTSRDAPAAPPPKSADIQIPSPPYVAPPSQGVLVEGTPVAPPREEPSRLEPLILPGESIPPTVLPVAPRSSAMRLELSAYPSVIRGNNSDMTTITWRGINAEACTLFGPNGYRDDSVSGSVSGSSERPATLHFELMCWQGDNEQVKSVEVVAR